MTTMETAGQTQGQRAEFKTFEESTYEDWQLIAKSMPATQYPVADRIIEHLRYMEHDFGGFPVNRLEHSLQTASRAERDGRDNEYVLCALIHDIGDVLAPMNHPSIAAGILKGFVSEQNHWMVEKHGIFQGYYFWHYLGGNRNARDEFTGHPYYEYTEEFCAKYDQTAFDPDYRSEPLEHYIPLIHETFRPKTS